MSGFPNAIARAQRDALERQTQDIREAIEATRASYGQSEPHLLGVSREAYQRIRHELFLLERAAGRALDEIQAARL